MWEAAVRELHARLSVRTGSLEREGFTDDRGIGADFRIVGRLVG
jgi:hypothetical protein